MNVVTNFPMPRISDKELMEWYNLTRSELKDFKQNSGLGFMRKEIKRVSKEVDSKPLRDYMKLVFVIKRNLELLLSETQDPGLAFRVLVGPFILEAGQIVKKMPEDYHDYCAWYTENQLYISRWVQRQSLDSLVDEYLPEKN